MSPAVNDCRRENICQKSVLFFTERAGVASRVRSAQELEGVNSVEQLGKWRDALAVLSSRNLDKCSKYNKGACLTVETGTLNEKM